MILILAIAAAVLAIVELVRTRAMSLAAWGVLALAAIHIVGGL